jgi:uncharacterized circularly permuted ATP-grasp superfamily protein/uncharacterized alpha-E superfamily protein
VAAVSSDSKFKVLGRSLEGRGLRWHEVLESSGGPREQYAAALRQLDELKPAQLRELQERMEGIMREMGVRYGSPTYGGPEQWRCDLLPQIFTTCEWARVAAGVQQRLRAFDFFLRDVYGERNILRDGVIPVHVVLGSPFYERSCKGLPLPRDAYLHLCGICLECDAMGALAVKGHQLGRARGIAYMMQNRRAVARVLPDFLEQTAVHSVAEIPTAISDAMREAAPVDEADDPLVVLLSPGAESASYYEHAFLARRTGFPLVQGGDLLVLDDHLYLKTVRGLQRVDVVYNRVADAWLDPLVLRRGSHLGVPGLVQCIRRGTVTLLNAVGSQLADDCALLSFGGKIIRYYLNEEPILPTVPTYWLGDLDQREHVLSNLSAYRIESISGATLVFGTGGVKESARALAQAIRKNPQRYVAQPAACACETVHFAGEKLTSGGQDHYIFALRRGQRFEVFPGGLTRVFPEDSKRPGEWLTKDTWVLGQGGETEPPHVQSRRLAEASTPMREVTSRVAEAFYWMGRYLERAYHQAYMIQAIETLESEELNSAERKEYRPMWNRLLPPLETAAGESRRSITTRLDRYRLTLAPKPGSLAVTLQRVWVNAELLQESLSPESSATLNSLRALFQRAKFREQIGEEEAGVTALRLCAKVTQRVPQFFAIAARTVLGDDGWRFCEVGERFERAVITAYAVSSIGKTLAQEAAATEIQLSAFLRLLGTRDAYRRVFQMRAAPAEVLEILWQHPEAPRSIARCLTEARHFLRESAAPGSHGAAKALAGIDELLVRLQHVDWKAELKRGDEFPKFLDKWLSATLEIHALVSDGFLSHQADIGQTAQPLLQGFRHAV